MYIHASMYVYSRNYALSIASASFHMGSRSIPWDPRAGILKHLGEVIGYLFLHCYFEIINVGTISRSEIISFCFSMMT